MLTKKRKEMDVDDNYNEEVVTTKVQTNETCKKFLTTRLDQKKKKKKRLKCDKQDLFWNLCFMDINTKLVPYSAT